MSDARQSGGRVGMLGWLLFTGLCTAATPEVVWEGAAVNSYSLNPVALSPDGGMAATLGTNNTVQIWRMSDGAPLLALGGNSLWVGALAFSPDGTYLASGGGDSSVRVWRTEDWSLAYTVPSAKPGPPVAFSPDSATLAMGNGPAIELRRATNGALFRSWPATLGEVAALAFSPDGAKLASGAGIRGQDTVLKIWSVADGALQQTAFTAQTYGVGRVVFSPDGLQVLSGSLAQLSGPVQAWRVSDGALLRTFSEAAYDMAFSADGTVLGAVGTNIAFFRTADGALIEKYGDIVPGVNGKRGIALTPTEGLFVRSRGQGEVLAGRVPVLVSPPVREGEQMVIRWVGGAGRYQLQRTSALGEWHDEGGILTTNAAVISTEAAVQFYRVIALP